MSDRHLCKAQRTDNRKWIEGYYAFIGKKHVIIEKTSEEFFSIDDGEDRSGSRILEVDPETVCRCTGPEDKNANLIWENDIVKHDISDTIGTVKWYKEDYVGWCVDDVHFHEQQFTDEMWNECEVIGNIFDNPELLEGGAE